MRAKWKRSKRPIIVAAAIATAIVFAAAIGIAGPKGSAIDIWDCHWCSCCVTDDIATSTVLLLPPSPPRIVAVAVAVAVAAISVDAGIRDMALLLVSILPVVSLLLLRGSIVNGTKFC
ncbi:MAG: hypothetical protein ABJZ99_17400 [Lentilitoribacter sp.]